MDKTVIVARETLDAEGAGAHYFLRKVAGLLVRASVLWFILAILAPSLGTTWYMAALVILLIEVVIPSPKSLSISQANTAFRRGESRRAEAKTISDTRTDNQLLTQRIHS